MSISFEFQELPGFDDFRGRIVVTAKGPADVLEAVKFFKLTGEDDSDEVARAMKLVELVQAGEVVHVVENDKRPWYEVNGTVADEYVRPYLKRLEQLTGYDRGVLPDLDFTKHFDKLSHGQFTERVWSEFGSLCFKAYDNAEDWSGETSAELAESYVNRHMAESLAYRPMEPEYIANHNGTYSRNPRYATGRLLPLVPCCAAKWLCDELWRWWLANESNESQRDLLNRCEALGVYTNPARHSGYGQSSYWGDYQGIYYKVETGGHDWDGKGTKFAVMKWEEFKVLK